MSIEAAFIVPHPPLIIPAVGHGREAENSADHRRLRRGCTPHRRARARARHRDLAPCACLPRLVPRLPRHARGGRPFAVPRIRHHARGGLRHRVCIRALRRSREAGVSGGNGWRARCRARPCNVHPAVVYRQVLHRLPCGAHRAFGLRQHQALPVRPAHQQMRR